MSDWSVVLTIIGWAVCVWGACSWVMRGLARFDRWLDARPARRDRVALREWRDQRAALHPTLPRPERCDRGCANPAWTARGAGLSPPSPPESCCER